MYSSLGLDPSNLSRTYLEANSLNQTGIMVSTRRLDMEKNLRSNIAAGNKPLTKTIFVRIAEQLKGPESALFEENLRLEYGDYLFFEFMNLSQGISKVNFAKEPVSCVITGYDDRFWAKKFSENQQNRDNLSIYLLCHDRNISEYQEIMDNFSNNRLKPVASYEDLQGLIRVEYELYSDKYINEVTEKRIRNKFYYKINNNEILNIYYEEELGKLVAPYVNPISTNKRFKKTNFFRFKDWKELLILAKGRSNIKRSQTKKIQRQVAASNKRIATTISLQNPNSSFSNPRSGPIGGYDQSLLLTAPTQHPDLLQPTQDLNYILVTYSNRDLQKIKKFCLSQPNTRMLILDSEKSLRELKQQMNIFSNENESMDRQRIVMSEKLLIMLYYEDEATRREVDQQENFNFHTEMVLLMSPQQLDAEIWRVHENQNYFGLLVLSEDKYAEWVGVIEKGIQFGRKGQIDNLKVIIKRQKDEEDPNVSLEYMYDVDPDKNYLTTPNFLAESDGQHTLIQQIFLARNLFYHPAMGIIGTRVYLYIRRNRTSLISQLSQTIQKNKRLLLQTYQDRQQLQYFVQKTHKTECALIITDQKELIDVMKITKGVENVYVLLLSEKARLSFDPQILKTGSEGEIQEFIRQVPDNTEEAGNQSYIETDEEEEGLGHQGYIQRVELDPDQVSIVLLPGRPLMVIRIPNNEESKNSILFENRIKNIFQDQVNFRTYQGTEQIRDMDKFEQPLQFLIINDSYLEWTKRMATVESNQKFEIIYFTKQNLEQFKDLIQKNRYLRFKLVSNKWQAIEDYIVGRASRWSKYKQQYTLKSNKSLHLILDPHSSNIQKILAGYALTHNNQIAKRCVYHYMNIQKQLPSYKPSYQKTFIILDQSKNPLKQFKLGLSIPLSTPRTTRLLVISPRQSKVPLHQRTAQVVSNQLQAANFIANIKFIEAETRTSVPMLCVADNDIGWRFWAKQEAYKSGRFTTQFYEKQEELRRVVQEFRSSSGSQMVWIVLHNPADLQALRARFSSEENIGFVIQDPEQEEPLQVGDVIISSSNRRQIETYLQNFKRRSKACIPPSHIPKSSSNKIMLITNKKFPINQQQINYWLSRAHAKVVSFGDTNQLQSILSQANPQTIIYLILSHDQDAVYEKTLRDIPNIKRIIVNFMTKQRPKYQHPTIGYIAHSLQQLHQYLSNLRFTIRNPPQLIQANFRHPILNIFLSDSHRPKCELKLKTFCRFNDSLRTHYYSTLSDLKDKLTHTQDHLLVVGSQQLITQLPKDGRVQYLSEDMYDEARSGIKLLGTDEWRECMLYLRNLPNLRFVDARRIAVPCRLFLKGKGVDGGIREKVEAAVKRNHSLSMLHYEDVRQLESYLYNMSAVEKAIILVQDLNDIPSVEKVIANVLKQHPDHSIQIALQIPKGSTIPNYPHIIFSGDSQQLLEDFVENIPYNRDIQGMPVVNLSDIAPTIVNREVSRADQSQFSNRSIFTDKSKSKSKRKIPTELVIKLNDNGNKDSSQSASLGGASLPARSQFKKDTIAPVEYVQAQPDTPMRFEQKPANFGVIPDSYIVGGSKVQTPNDPLRIYTSKALSYANVATASFEPIPKPYGLPKKAPPPVIVAPVDKPTRPIVPIQNFISKVGQNPSVASSRSPRSSARSRQSSSKTSSIPPLQNQQTSLPLLAVFYPQYIADISRAAEYIANNSPSTFVKGFPFSSFNQVKKTLPTIYSQYNKVLILTSDNSQLSQASQLCPKFPRSRFYPRLTRNLLTQISIVFNLHWQDKPLPLPYINPLVPDQLVQSQHLNIFLPSQHIHSLTDLLDYAVTVRNYRQPSELIDLLERFYDGGDVHSRGSTNVYNLLVVGERELEGMCRLPFIYPRLRLLVMTSRVTVRQWFDRFGDILWLCADGSQRGVMKELEKLVKVDLPKLNEGRRPVRGLLVEHVLYYTDQQRDGLISLDLIGYRKRQYTNKAELERFIDELLPHQLGYVLITEDGRFIIQPLPNLTFVKRNKQLSGYLKNHYPNSTVVNYQTTKDIQRELQNKLSNGFPLSARVLHQQRDRDIQNLKNKYPFLKFVAVDPTDEQDSYRQSSEMMRPQKKTQTITKATSTTGLEPSPNGIIKKGSGKSNARSSSDDESMRRSKILKMIDDAVSKSKGDVGLYYLCNWLPKKPDKWLQHVNVEQLSKIFKEKPNQLLVVFSEKDEFKRLHPSILQSSRVKLIAVSDDPNSPSPSNLLIHPKQLSQTSQLVLKMIQSSKCDYIVYRDDPLCQPKATLIQDDYKQCDVFTRTFSDLPTLKRLILELKQKCHYLHIVCLGEERQQVQGLVEECKVERYYIHSVGGVTAKVRTMGKDEKGQVKSGSGIAPWAGLPEKIQYELVGIDQAIRKKTTSSRVSSAKSSQKLVDMIVVSHNYRSRGEQGSRLYDEVMANGGSVSYSNRSELLSDLDKMDHRPVIIALEDNPSPKNHSYIVYDKDLQIQLQTLPKMPSNSRVISDSSVLKTALHQPTLIILPQKPQPQSPNRSPLLQDNPLTPMTINLPSKNRLNLGDYQYTRIAYDQSLSKQNQLNLADLALNNKNILAKKYTSKEALKKLLNGTPGSDCCVVVNDNSALDNEVNQYPNATRITQRQFRTMCGNRRNGKVLQIPLEVIREQEEGEGEEEQHNELKELDQAELEDLLRKCEQPRGSVVHDKEVSVSRDKPASISADPSRASSSIRLNQLHNEAIQQDPQDSQSLRWIQQNLYKFSPILNGQLLRLAIPTTQTPLKQHLSQTLSQLMVIRYADAPYLQSYLSSNSKYPTVVFLPQELSHIASQLLDKYTHVRIIQMGERMMEKNGVSLNVSANDDVEYLMRELMRMNEEVDQRVNKGTAGGRVCQQIDKDESNLIPLADSTEKVYIVYNPHRNDLIKQLIQKSLGNKVIFLPYNSPSDIASTLLPTLPLGCHLLILSNDQQTPLIQSLPFRQHTPYFLRYISNHMRPTNIEYNNRLLFTGFTLQSIANYLTNLLLRSYKRAERRERARRVDKRREEQVDLREEKKYRRHYKPSIFGTAHRFDHYDQKYVPLEDSTRVNSAERGHASWRKYQLKLRKSPQQNFKRIHSQYA